LQTVQEKLRENLKHNFSMKQNRLHPEFFSNKTYSAEAVVALAGNRP